MPVAIVTGGAVRLGRAIALHLAGRGYDIALHHGFSQKPPSKPLRRYERRVSAVKRIKSISLTSMRLLC